MKLTLSVGFAVFVSVVCGGGAFAAPGSLDPGFGSGGILRITAEGSGLNLGTDVLAQGDGKVLVLATSGSCILLARRNHDGSADLSFNAGATPGKNLLCPGGLSEAQAMALQSDGKIVVAGRFEGQMAILRYLSSGELDPQFNAAGAQPGVHRLSIASSSGKNILVQEDGKILALGQSLGTKLIPKKIGILVRLNADGSLDSRLAGDGTLEIDYQDNPLTNSFRGLAKQANGTIVVGNTLKIDLTNTGLVYGFLPNGGLSSLFDGDGIVQPTLDEEITIRDIAVQSDDKILFTGALSDGATQYAYIGRLTSFGFPDTGEYGSAWGRTTIPLDAAVPVHSGYDLAIQDDGKAVLLGNFNNQSFVIARFSEEGYPDPQFGDYGAQMIDAGGVPFVSALAVQPDGKLLAVGSADEDIVVLRLMGNTADLRVDTALNNTPAEAGAELTFHLTISNRGPNDSGMAYLSPVASEIFSLGVLETEQGTCDFAQESKCSLGVIATGQVKIATLHATLNSGPIPSGMVPVATLHGGQVVETSSSDNLVQVSFEGTPSNTGGFETTQPGSEENALAAGCSLHRAPN